MRRFRKEAPAQALRGKRVGYLPTLRPLLFTTLGAPYCGVPFLPLGENISIGGKISLYWKYFPHPTIRFRGLQINSRALRPTGRYYRLAVLRDPDDAQVEAKDRVRTVLPLNALARNIFPARPLDAARGLRPRLAHHPRLCARDAGRAGGRRRKPQTASGAAATTGIRRGIWQKPGKWIGGAAGRVKESVGNAEKKW